MKMLAKGECIGTKYDNDQSSNMSKQLIINKFKDFSNFLNIHLTNISYCALPTFHLVFANKIPIMVFLKQTFSVLYASPIVDMLDH